MPKPLLLALTLALAACESSSLDSPASSDTPQPNPVSITDISISDDQATISWSASGPEPGEYWRLYQNNLLVCSANLELSSPDANGDYQQSHACTITLEAGDNSVYVQLCNLSSGGDSTCSNSATELISQEQTIDHTPGAISWQDLPSSTSASSVSATWIKAEGGNGDYWLAYNNGAQACFGDLSYTEDDVAQSAACEIRLVEGVNQLQAELCYDQPVGIQDPCSQSAIASITLTLDSANELATPVLAALDGSDHYAGIDTSINWYKDTSSGSAGEDWSLYRNGAVVCQGQLAADATSASCTIQLTTGDNTLQIELCTDVATYSGASCAQSNTLAVAALDPNPLSPGIIEIVNASAILAESSDSVLPLEWAIDIGNGVQNWSVDLNGAEHCITTSTSEYYREGSCQLDLAVGVNTISVSGCNHGYEDRSSCSTSEAITTELIALPGVPALTASLPPTTYAAEHNLSWERTTGASAERWLAVVDGDIESDQCQTELSAQTPQSDSCIVELGSGINEVLVRLCVDSSTSTYCVDSASLYSELLAPIPGAPQISTESQSIAEASIELEWSKSSGEHGSYWLALNNDAEVAACSDQPLLSAGDEQLGSCTLPLELGDNIVSVRLCSDNNAGTASCADSATISITRFIASLEFTSAASVVAAENSTAVFYTATAEANDSSAGQISFALSGGADADFFSLDSASGALAFQSAVDYEIAQDSDADNVYQVILSAADELGDSAQLELAVSLSNINDNAPSLTTPPATLTTAENDSAVIYTFTASDLDGDTLSYSLDGADAQHFTLGATSGALQFQYAPDYETPLDANQDNVYELAISVADGEYNSTEQLSVAVSDSYDEIPQATSASSVALAIDSLVVGATVYTAQATDADAGDQIAYTLGGVDQQHFVLGASSGELAFSQLPVSLDDPQDADGDNSYEVLITLTDLGGNSSELALSINIVAALGNAPEFAAATASVTFDENAVAAVYSAQATDADNDALAYSISGIDSSHFTIDATSGVIAFNSPPDYEQPADSDSDNAYDLAIAATDPLGNQAQQSLTVTVTNLNDNAPQFTLSSNTFDIPENSTAITTITATDLDSDEFTLALTTTADSSHFTFDPASGALAFNSAPDHESPQDANADNTYELTLTATDSAYSTSQDLAIRVANVDEAPSFAAASQDLSVNENSSGTIYTAAASDPEQASLTYSASGADASLFTLDSASGALAFIAPPNFEQPTDQDANNVYQLAITAADGANQASQDLTITVADSNEAPSFTEASVALTTAENNSSFAYVVAAAVDEDSGEQLAYQLSGDDQSAFSFDPSTRALSFKQSPDFDNPKDQDADNVYQISISAADADYSTSQAIAITVADLNDEAPQFTSLSSLALDYSSIVVGATVYTAQATDADAGDQIAYALGGADQQHFALDSSSGNLVFTQSPSLDTPQDADGDNSYQLVIAATDLANNSSELDLSINVVNDAGSAPEFASASASIAIAENTTSSIYTAAASDPDGDSLAYSIAGADSSLFTIDPASGDLAFVSPPDHEQPTDSGADNVYDLAIIATDSPVGNQAQQSLAVTVTNLNDNQPQFNLSSSTFAVPENSTAITTIIATDLDTDTLTYALINTTDSSHFTLDPTSGALIFNQAPNYESPQDANADNDYQLELSVSDGTYTTSQAITVRVADVDEAPAFTAASQDLSVNENSSGTIYTAAASDPEQASLAYSASGADAALFTLNSTSGALAFITPPNFEQPTDQDANNVYQLAITATDGANQASQDLTITIADSNEAPSFAEASVALSTAENDSSFTHIVAAAVDEDSGETLTYQLGGDDAAAFNFDPATRALSFKQSPDFENPEDQDADNTYQIAITAADSQYSTTQAITIAVANIDEAPSFATTTQDLSVNENTSGSVYQAQASDPEQASLTYSISGIDSSHFTIDPVSGDLTFVAAPDYESPSDSGADNTYDLTIAATDSIGNQAQQSLAISVNNLNDNQPQFNLSSSTFTVPENSTAVTTIAASDADGDTLTFALITSTDSDHFTLDPASGALAFNQAANYEDPQDANTDNTYQLELSVADGSHTTSQAITVAVADLNDEAPQFTSATTEAIDYSDIVLGATVYTATSTDADANDQISYTLGGADQQHFALDSSSGALAFSELPSLVNPKDANTDNTYELTITATDLGANSTDLALSISVIDTGSAPTFAQASASVSVDENTISTIYTAQATDADTNDQITYSLTGADAEHFTIDPSSGDLSFNQAPDHEQPTDSDSDNTYDLAIVATDSVGKQAQQDLTISVNNLNDNQPAFNLSSNSFDVPESSTAVATIAASDADGDELSFALLTTSDDSSHFTLDPASGDLSFNQAPNYEKPQDANTDNTYELELSVSDGSHTTTQAIAIKVTDVDGEPYFHSTADYVDSVVEGTEAPFLVLHIQAADAEDDADKKILYFTISGGDDADKFILKAVDRNSANLSFNISPDFENPQDSNLDNNYSVTLQVEDSDEYTAQHDLIVAVQDVNDEAPQLTSASSVEVNENSTEVFYIATAEDDDSSGDSLTFSLESTNYPDSALFSINSSSGELQAINGLDYEHPISNKQSNDYIVGIKVADPAGNSSTSALTISVIDDPDDAHPAAESGPQIPWFYSDSSAREHILIPWVIYVGDGVVEWEMFVNDEVKCRVSSGLSSPLTSGTCVVPTSEFTIGSVDNTARVSVLYPDGSTSSSKAVTFGYAVPETEGYYPEQTMLLGGSLVDSGYPSDCADVEIGEPVNHDSHSGCYNYLLADDFFGGGYDDVPAYLWSGKYGRGFDVIAYFIEWGVYARDFDAHDLRANWLSTVLYSFIKFEGDNTTADDECENCTFSGAVAIADPWAALDKPFYMPGEEEEYADEADSEEELAEILADKAHMTGKGIFQQFWLLKQKFPHLKTCLSVGGWSFSRPFPLVASDPDKRATFAQSIVDMAVEYHFDCIDIDWEFPGKAGGDRVATHNGVATYDLDGDGISPFIDPSAADADYFVDLVAALRSEIVSRPEAAHIEINSAVYTSSEGMALMDYGSFPNDLDGIHMMTYDYYGAWDPYTGLQAALYANTNPVSDDVALAYGNPYNPEHNIASAMARGVNNAIYNGFEPEIMAVDSDSATNSDVSQTTLANVGIRQKIVPGLAFYGRNYSGVNMDTPDRGKYMVRATGTTGKSDGSAEQLGWEPGNLNYVQVQGYYFHGDKVWGNEHYDAGGYGTGDYTWTYYWDDESQTPFLYNADKDSFVSYTDPRAIYYQTCHAAWHNSKGVMFWEASGDGNGDDLLMFIHLALQEYIVGTSDGRTYSVCEDLDGIYQRGDVVYSDGSVGGDGEPDLAGYGLDELVDLGHFSEDIFSNFMFPWRNGDPSVSDGSETYTWDGFAKAADHFADFGFLNEGSIEDRLRELAAFFANSSQETHNSHGVYALINKDGVIGQGRYNAGYYYQQEQACAVGGADYGEDICSYCDASDTAYGVACDWLYENGSGKADDFYYGRGPMQLRWNYDYGAFGQYYYQDPDLLLYNPNMLVQDSEAAFASAIWYWMTERDGKPSAHDVMILGNYTDGPEFSVSEEGRHPGFGMTINVTRGESECGAAYDHDANRNRIGFYITYLNILEDHYDPGEGLSPWVGTNGSEPSKSHDFPTKVEDLISEHQDIETYLSCKNMENYE